MLYHGVLVTIETRPAAHDGTSSSDLPAVRSGLVCGSLRRHSPWRLAEFGPSGSVGAILVAVAMAIGIARRSDQPEQRYRRTAHVAGVRSDRHDTVLTGLSDIYRSRSKPSTKRRRSDARTLRDAMARDASVELPRSRVTPGCVSASRLAGRTMNPPRAVHPALGKALGGR